MKWSKKFDDDNSFERRLYLQRRAMFNSIHRKCNCGKQASFNYPSIKYAIYCKSCKLDGMINVRKK